MQNQCVGKRCGGPAIEACFDQGVESPPRRDKERGDVKSILVFPQISGWTTSPVRQA